MESLNAYPEIKKKRMIKAFLERNEQLAARRKILNAHIAVLKRRYSIRARKESIGHLQARLTQIKLQEFEEKKG